MFDRIEIIEDKILCGLSMQMSVADDKTKALWSSFMPQRAMIHNKKNTDFYSLQVYHKAFDYNNFNPNETFHKWAAVEVRDIKSIPNQLQFFTLYGGLYAVFIHRGTPQVFHKTLQFIFENWLPSSDYQIDNRPHFELLSENYRPDDPSATEEVWIPICQKQA